MNVFFVWFWFFVTCFGKRIENISVLNVTGVRSAPVTVGRFQVTPSMDLPAPGATQLVGGSSSPSESSTEEQAESETSLATSLTMSPPHPRPHRGAAGLLQEVDGQAGWAGSQEQQQDGAEEDEEEDDEEDGEDDVIGERPRARRRSRRRAYSLTLMGTSADSGLSVTAAEMEGRLWDGAASSPQYSNALHHLWTMAYSRGAPYLSSDDSDSDDEDMLEELQGLREK